MILDIESHTKIANGGNIEIAMLSLGYNSILQMFRKMPSSKARSNVSIIAN